MKGSDEPLNKSKQLMLIIGLPILCFVIGFFGVKWYLTGQGTLAGEPASTALAGKMPSPVQNREEALVEEEVPAATEEEVAQTSGEEDEEKSGAVETEIVVLQPLRLYAVQVGSFSSGDAAAEAVAALVASGQPASIIEDGYHKVIVACSGQKDAIAAMIPTVRETHEGAFTLEIPLDERRVEVPAGVADDLAQKDEMVKGALVEVGQQFTWPIGIEGSVTIAPAEGIDSLEGEAEGVDKTLTDVANRLDRMRSGSAQTAWQLYLDSVSQMSSVQ